MFEPTLKVAAGTPLNAAPVARSSAKPVPVIVTTPPGQIPATSGNPDAGEKLVIVAARADPARSRENVSRTAAVAAVRNERRARINPLPLKSLDMKPPGRALGDEEKARAKILRSSTQDNPQNRR